MIIQEATLVQEQELNQFYIRMNEVINRRTNQYNPDNAVFPSAEMIHGAIVNHQQFVGLEDGKIVIASIVNHDCAAGYNDIHWQVEAGAEEFWVLHALRVLPEQEGKGFAKQMLKFLIDLAPKRGIKAIRLDVLEGYNVDGLYRAMGFSYVDTIEIFYEDIGYPARFRLLEKVV